MVLQLGINDWSACDFVGFEQNDREGIKFCEIGHSIAKLMVNQTVPRWNDLFPRVSGLVMLLQGLQCIGVQLRAIMSHFVTSPNTNIPGAMRVINQTFRTICHCAHPTDTNGYREMRVLFCLTGPMCSTSGVLVTGGTCEKLQSAAWVRCRSMQMKGSMDDRMVHPHPK